MPKKSSALLFLLLFLTFPAARAKDTRPSEVHAGFATVVVIARAPIPEELGNTTQGRALSREAAVVIAQTRLLEYILSREAHSGKPLAQAEIPDIDLQKEIRGTVQGAQVTSTTWTAKECKVKLVFPKSRLRVLLKKG